MRRRKKAKVDRKLILKSVNSYLTGLGINPKLKRKAINDIKKYVLRKRNPRYMRLALSGYLAGLTGSAKTANEFMRFLKRRKIL